MELESQNPEEKLQAAINNAATAQTIIDLGIEPPVVAQLINNNADLKDIATNAQILLNSGIKVSLVNRWLKNGTHLSDAIAIVNLGVNLNMIGTSSKVGNFIGLTGVSPDEVVSRIPEYAEIEKWTSALGGAQQGMKFYWKDISGKARRIRMHGPDPSAPNGSNAACGWVLRVQRGKWFMDSTGEFIRPGSPAYTEEKANDTHMPILSPDAKFVL